MSCTLAAKDTRVLGNKRGSDWYFVSGGNAGSGSYTVSVGGSLTLLNAVAASAGGARDMAFTTDSRFLYVRNANGTISGVELGADGSSAWRLLAFPFEQEGGSNV